MGTKTKAQLEHEIAELKVRVKEQDRTEANDAAAKQLFDVFRAYCDAGFDADQAWELVKILMLNGTKPRGLFGGV